MKNIEIKIRITIKIRRGRRGEVRSVLPRHWVMR
jgi:hypothetical protein